VEDDRPATLSDIRSLRRWLAVAIVWAAAATALGVIALLEANDDDNGDQTRAATALGRVQRQLNSRIDGLESGISDLPTSEDVSKLDGRLKSVEDKVDKSTTAGKRLSSRMDDVETRLDDLEKSVDDLDARVEELESSSSGTTTTP